jgi:hypothetical protein
MHKLLIDIINPDDNSVVKSGVTMTTDGKLSVCEMNSILFKQGGNVFRVVEVITKNPNLQFNLF